MTLGEILSAGVVLQSFGIVGLLAIDSATPAEPSKSGQSPEREALRREHQTSIIQRSDEGCGIDEVPNGTYGFTYAPAATSPLFANRAFQSFEMHKAADGMRHLLGYVTPAEAEQIAQGGAAAEVRLFPDPCQEATQFVCLPLDRMKRKSRNPTHEEGNWVAFVVEPK